MTIKDFKELLSKYPEDMEIKISTYISNDAYDDKGRWEDLNINTLRYDKRIGSEGNYLIIDTEEAEY